jgi:hypothetical protein
MMFLTEFYGSDATRLTAAADTVFAALVDVDRLPEWNARIHHVIESPAPASPVAEGTEWVVQMRASGGRWPSRSRALVVDPAAGRFEYCPADHDAVTHAGHPAEEMSWLAASTMQCPRHLQATTRAKEVRAMARVSRDSAPEVVDYGPAEDRTGHSTGTPSTSPRSGRTPTSRLS